MIKKILFLITFISINLFFSPIETKAVETQFAMEILDVTPTPTPINSTSTSNSSTNNQVSAPICNAGKPGSAPIIISATRGTNSVTLKWSKGDTPLTKYLVAYGTKSGSIQFGNPDVGGMDTTSYTIQGLSGGTRYYFRIKAINECMPGDFSNEVSSIPNGKIVSSSTTTTITTTTTEETPAENFVPISQIPSELFDIALIVDKTQIAKASELAARVTFISFGSKTTPAEMTFTIVDLDGKEYYRSVDRTVIQTEGVFNKNFGQLQLPNGKYKLVLTTLYNTNIKDEFKQDFEVGNFTISPTSKFLENKPLIIAIWVVFVLGIVFAIMAIIKNKKNIKYPLKK